MKANKIYGLLSVLALTAVCASAFAQGGPPPQDDQNGPPPPQGPGGLGPDGMHRHMGPPVEPLFMRPDVQKELKLTDDQIAKLRELLPPPPMGRQDQFGGQPGGPPLPGGDRGGPPQGDEGMRPRGDGPMGPQQMDAKLAQVLNDAQMKRLKELRLQREGGMALMRKDVADQVGLSDEERQRIRGMVDEAIESMHSQQGQQGLTMQEKHKKLSDQILAALTSAERSKWDALCGKPFKFDENWRPQRPQGGPGGEPRQPGGDGGPPPPSDDGGL